MSVLTNRLKRLENAQEKRTERILLAEFERRTELELDFFIEHGYWPQTAKEITASHKSVPPGEMACP